MREKQRKKNKAMLKMVKIVKKEETKIGLRKSFRKIDR
jgi:hypothetical protein